VLSLAILVLIGGFLAFSLSGIIKMRASSVRGDAYLPRNAAKLESLSIVNSKDEANQWVKWDFKTAQIEVTPYSIRTTVNITTLIFETGFGRSK
jgi:hypothetical protein